MLNLDREVGARSRAEFDMKPLIRAVPFLLVLLVLLATPAVAEARCHETEFRKMREALRHELRCDARSLRGHHASCKAKLPACGQALVDDLRDVLGGGASKGALRSAERPQARCQMAALRAGRRYVDRRMRERAEGRRGASYARRFVARVEASCDGVVVGPELPSFGGVCRELLAPGDPVPASEVAHCLRASLEGAIDDQAPEPLRPNFVLIVTDDQRADTLPFMPALDRLADQGIRFTNAFVTTTLCVPSRASIFSGLYAHNHGSRTNYDFGFDDSDTLAPWVSSAGYATGFFGKYRNDTARGPQIPLGWTEWQAFTDPPDLDPTCPGGGNCYFDYFLNENGELVFHGDDEESYSTDLLAQRTLDFIAESAKRPFLAVYSPAAPHGPSIPALRHEGAYADLPLWRPPSWGIAGLKPLWLLYIQRRFNSAVAAAIDARRIDELESLLAVDDAVRDIVDELERRGVRDHTLFLFTSDHGVHWGEHGWSTKITPYEESIRVPFVVSYPVRAPLPLELPEMVLNIDIAPTIAAAAGASTGPVDGRNFLELLEPGTRWRKSFLIENALSYLVRPSDAVRTERWKYIETVGPGVRFELYDLDADPYEIENVVDHPDNQLIRGILERELDILREL